MNKTRIVILGAGYAGLLATLRLAGKTRRDNVSITLVNSSENFVERLRLHQFAANQTIPARSIPKLLQGTGVEFVRGIVTRLTPAAQQVHIQTDTGTQTLPYDYLLYALGSTIDRDRVPGVREHAYTLTPSGSHSAETLRQILPDIAARGGYLLICGGGATGIESAAEFAESYPQLKVQLVTRGDLGMFLGHTAAGYLRQTLSGFRVTVQDHTTITQLHSDHALTNGPGPVPFDVCLWCGGFSVSPLARAAGLSVNERGQILIDPYMRSISHPDIYAIGDAAMPMREPGVRVRMSAFTAVVLGAHGADTLTAALHQQSLKPLSFAYMGQGIALGRHNTLGFSTYPDDKPHAPYFTGRVGYEVREWFVRLLADLPNIEKRVPGFFYWLGKGRFDAAQRRLPAAHSADGRATL